MLIDPKCYELAEYFLADMTGVTDKMRLELAEDLQVAVEYFIEQARREGLISDD
jgi:hypothetical protein